MNTRREIVLEKDSVAGKPFILSQAVTIVLNCEQAEAKPLSLRKLQMVQQVWKIRTVIAMIGYAFVLSRSRLYIIPQPHW